MKKRLLIRSFLIMFFVISNITMSVTVPFTNAKYLKEENIPYETSMHIRDKEFNVSFVNTTIEDDQVYANYSVSFNRIVMNYPGEKDKYTFYARVNNEGEAGYNTCSLDVGAINHVSYDSGVAVFEYSASNIVSTVSFMAKCNVTSFDGGIPIYFNVSEKIANDASFDIGSYTATYYNYDLYAKIISDFETSSDYSSYDSALRDLMKIYFRNDIKSLGDMYNGVQVDGLTYSIPTNHYELDDYFIGYSISFVNKNVVNNYYSFAFLPTSQLNNTTATARMGTVFKYYLEKYLHYDEQYIAKVEQYFLDSTPADDTLDEALLQIINSDTHYIIDVSRNTSPTISQVPEIVYNADIVENIINIKYGLSDTIWIDVGLGDYSVGKYYKTLIKHYGINELTATADGTQGAFIKSQFVELPANNSKLFLASGTLGGNTVKFLVNEYQKTVTVTNGTSTLDRTFNYLSVQVLEEGAEITLNKDTTTILYDETNTEIPTSSTEDIINEIGKFVYGNDYQLPNYVEDGNIVTYTLTE